MKQIYIVLFILTFFSLSADINRSELDSRDIWSKKESGSTTYYTKKDLGRIPVLCFHKIGLDDRYELTAANFEEFLIYLNTNKFYPLSDKELLLRDFSMIPSGFTPIVLGSDDASEGNFEFKTIGTDKINGEIDRSTGSSENLEDSMVYLLEKYIKPVNERINFTFYISFDGLPFRQSGGSETTGKYYRGIPVVKEKINYLLDSFIVGIHTVTHPITKNTDANKFKWELDEFFSIMRDYVGDRSNLIDTLAYPYGCADLNPELREMLVGYENKNQTILGSFDFDGYFSKSPFNSRFDNFEVSRLGVDNQNIDNVYGFLESVKLFDTTRVIVVESEDDLASINYNSDDTIIIGEL